MGFYYNVIIAYCLYYLLFSIRAKLPWADCEASFINCFKCQNTSGNCSLEKIEFMKNNSGNTDNADDDDNSTKHGNNKKRKKH